MPEQQTKGKPAVMQFLLTFAIIYLATTAGLKLLFPDRFSGSEKEVTPVTLKAEHRSVPLGRNVIVLLQNGTNQTLTLPDRCPAPPLTIEREKDSVFSLLPANHPAGFLCTHGTDIAPGATTRIDLSPWKYDAFGETGTYRVSLPSNILPAAATGGTLSAEIVMTQPGFLTSAFRAFISKPMLNALVLIASILPGHSLGWSIILLTLLVKFLLFFPSQHALKSQKKLQTIQPKIEDIKRRHDGDQQKITEETMKLWKTEKINPLQSCLPTVIQIPILIGLFYIIRDSGSLELARHLLYPPFLSLTWSFGTHFLGVLDLAQVPFAGMSFSPSAALLLHFFRGLPLPLATATLQFVQMKLAFKKADAKKAVLDIGTKPSLAERMDTQTMMMYMLPVMILFFSGNLPAAVSLYWVTSTVFAIGQQMIVNKK